MKALRIWRSDNAFTALYFVFLISICSVPAHAGAAEAVAGEHALEFVTEELPPLNFSTNGRADGFGSDVVREILRRENLSAPITILPWPRAYKIAQSEPNIGIYCMVRSAEREKLFQWVGPIANLDSRMYVKHDSNLQINSLADARNAAHVIVSRDGYNAGVLDKLGFKNLIMVNSPSEGLRLLLISNEKSLLVISPTSLQDALHRTSTPADAIKQVFNATKSQLYIGFSHDTSPTFVGHLQHTLDSMKADGTFAAIHQKWLPGEKPPGPESEPEISPAN